MFLVVDWGFFWCGVLVLCFLGLMGLFVCFSGGICLLMSLVSVISEKL